MPLIIKAYHLAPNPATGFSNPSIQSSIQSPCHQIPSYYLLDVLHIQPVMPISLLSYLIRSVDII